MPETGDGGGAVVPNVRSKARQRAKAMCLTFALLDLEYKGIRRRAKSTRWGENTQQFTEVGRSRTIHSMKAHACNFVPDTFCNGNPVQFSQEGQRKVMTGCHENDFVAKSNKYPRFTKDS